MTRLPQTLIVLALLGATAAAFAVTEHLKLERSPITGTKVDPVFSPICECYRDVAVISFVLRQAGVVTVGILDGDGKLVRTLVRNRAEEKGRVSYTWDGRDELERLVDEGRYRPRVELERHGRTIVLPNPIRVDKTAPRIKAARIFPRLFSPDGDGRRDRVTATYELDEPATATLLVERRRRVASKFRATKGRLVWFGRVNGRSVRPGTYEIQVRALDRANNRSRSTRPVLVRVRYVELARKRLRVGAGKRFGIRVSTDARTYRWLFAGERGGRTAELLVLRAPKKPGRYTVYVTVGRYADSARVTVFKTKK